MTDFIVRAAEWVVRRFVPATGRHRAPKAPPTRDDNRPNPPRSPRKLERIARPLPVALPLPEDRIALVRPYVALCPSLNGGEVR